MRVLTAILVVVVGAAVVVWSGIPTEDPARTGVEYVALFDDAELSGLADPETTVAITGDDALDERIRSHAEQRGYRVRPLTTGVLVAIAGSGVDDLLLQPEAAAAWEALQQAARLDGHDLVLVSAHRSPERQREYFVAALGGDTSDPAIERALAGTAPPGYSKHQTGYAIDLGVEGVTEFASTDAYGWVTSDDYANARRFGFVPSYPPDGGMQGPDPEPWEFVWVGRETIRCGIGGEICRLFLRDE